MKVSGALLAVVLLLFVDLSSGAKEKQTRNVVVTADDEKVRDAAGYAAIAEIHKEMDDDHSGSIDRKETSGFMTEDMHMRSSDRVKRENAFHGDDDAITVDDLWEAWFESEERAWTTEQLLHWVVDVINLPMYADMIVKYKLDGTVLPRLAVHNATFMTQKLGIKSSVHRQKLRLNALDVVLFGYREVSSRSKDIALALLLLVLTSVLILFARQRQRSRREVGELSSRLTQLKSMETEFEDVQKKWNDERSKRSTTDGGVNKMEMESLRIQLQEAERRLEQGGADGGGTPLALQPLLRRTCENEMAFLEKQRQDCFKEMKDAIEMVDRLQKKTSSVLSSLKLATGASTASDQVDSKIFALKSRMEKIHGLTRDTQERWLQIESLCGFPILYLNEQMNGGMYSQSSHFYASNSGASSESSRSLPNGASSSTTITSSNGQTTTTTTGGPIIQQKVQPFHAQRQELDDPQLFPSNGLGSDASAATVRLVPISHADSSLLKQTEDNLSTSSSEVKKRRAFAKLNIFKKSSSKNSLK